MPPAKKKIEALNIRGFSEKLREDCKMAAIKSGQRTLRQWVMKTLRTQADIDLGKPGGKKGYD